MGEFFVRRPIVAMVLSIIIVIVGLLALRSVPISQYPEITPPTIKINTSFVGANAVNVEQGVASVIEQKINGVEEMIYMKSTNASDGNLSLDVSFKVGTNLDNANMLTQNRVSQATPFMPPSVKQFGITTKKSLLSLCLMISLVSENLHMMTGFLQTMQLSTLWMQFQESAELVKLSFLDRVTMR